MYDVIYEAEIALCNINKQPLQLSYNAKSDIKTLFLNGLNVQMSLILFKQRR